MRISRAGVNLIMLAAIAIGIVLGTRVYALFTGG
jgi:hypothetical protein